MIKYYKYIILVVIFATFSSCAGKSNKQYENVIEFESWNFISNSQKCAISSFPISSSYDNINRKSHYITIVKNHKKSSQLKYFLIAVGGDEYTENSLVRVQFHDKSLFLKTHKDMAWSSKNISYIINKMQEEPSYFLLYSKFNNDSAIDKYSLKGFNNAYTYLQEHC